MKHAYGYIVHLLCTCTLIICSVLFFVSCKKFITIPPPETQVEGIKVFENDQAAIAAVTGLYSQIMQSNLTLANGAATLYPALSADELYNTAPNVDYDGFRTNQIIADGSGLPRLWSFGYRYSYHANAVIEGLQASPVITDSLRKQLTGEMLLVRAFSHLLLVNFFGDIPLVASTSFQENEALPRTLSAIVFEKIIADLLQAKQLLSEAYPTASRSRPNKWTASSLLTRAYLYTGQWALAETEASAIINSGLYSVVPVLNNVFLSNSNEAIWQISSVSQSLNTTEGNIFIPSSATTRPAFAATDQLLTAFEPNDLRKTNWLKAVTISNQPYSYPYKYKVRTGAPPYTEYNMIIRLAEIFLIRAEARTMLNNTSAALQDINIIRSRAGLPPVTAGTNAELLAAIAQERRLEFMFEWGHRWIDLKRTGAIDNVLGPVKAPNWQSTDSLYPIPKYELDTNPFLIQNPGY